MIINLSFSILYKKIMQGSLVRCQKRLQKELEDLKKYEDILKVEVDDKNTFLWKVSFVGAEGTLYAGEAYSLQFKFSPDYVNCQILSIANR
jgi:ubiquitin-protein ligase